MRPERSRQTGAPPGEHRSNDGDACGDETSLHGPVERQHSAGGLVVRGQQILLISPRGSRRWQMPKGRLESGESPEEAATREVLEETGVYGRLRSYLGSISYRFKERGRRIDKRVDYFLFQYDRGSETDFCRKEVERVEWLTWSDAIDRLTFDNERSLVQKAMQSFETFSDGRDS